MTDKKYLGWSGTERRTTIRPYCDHCFDGKHDVDSHGPLGCTRTLASGFACDCGYGATVDFRAPLPPDDFRTMGTMLLERASRLRGGKRAGERKKAQAAMRRSVA